MLCGAAKPSSPFPASDRARASYRRARPLLGTIVDIRLEGPAEACAAAAHAAFSAIEEVQRRMNFYDRRSELSRWNDTVHLSPVSASPLLGEVLRFSLALEDASGGVFHPDVAETVTGKKSSTVREIQPGVFFADGLVRYNLSGIAKGFAVDEAVRVLRWWPELGGVVNAGGDLRVFGECHEPLSVRLPGETLQYVTGLSVYSGAVATSVPANHAGVGAGSDVRSGPGERGAPAAPDCNTGIIVCAPTCMAADALTKVAFFAEQCPPGVFQSYGARVLRLSVREGEVQLEEWSDATETPEPSRRPAAQDKQNDDRTRYGS